MTFNDIASTVCTIVQETDGDSFQAALLFAKNWYRVTWNSHNWKSTKRQVLLQIPGNAAGWFADHIYGEILNIGVAPDLVTTPIEIQYRDIGWIKQNDPFAIVPGVVGPLPRYYFKAFTRGVPILSDGPISVNLSPQTVTTSASLVIAGINNLVSGSNLITGSVFRDIYLNEELNVGVPALTVANSANPYTEITDLSLANNTGSVIITATSANNQWTKASSLPEEKFVFSYYQVYPVVRTSFYTYIEYKLKLPDQLQNDDNLSIDNVDDAIIAFTQSQMLERQENYSQAAAKKKDATDVIDEAKRIEREQAHHQDQLVPNVYDNAWRLYWTYPYRF